MLGPWELRHRLHWLTATTFSKWQQEERMKGGVSRMAFALTTLGRSQMDILELMCYNIEKIT